MKASKKQDQISIWGFWVTVCGEITSMEQTRIWFILPNMAFWPVVVVLGFWLEMFVYWSVGMLWPRRYVGKAAAGIMPAVALYGLRSTDFQRVQEIYPANMLLFGLVGGLLTIVLVGRHLVDPEVADRRPVISTVRQAKY